MVNSHQCQGQQDRVGPSVPWKVLQLLVLMRCLVKWGLDCTTCHLLLLCIQIIFHSKEENDFYFWMDITSFFYLGNLTVIVHSYNLFQMRYEVELFMCISKVNWDRIKCDIKSGFESLEICISS